MNEPATSAPSPGKTIVRCRDLTRYYRDGDHSVTALAGFSFDFPGGQMVAIRGPSGSGKSTLLSLIAAIDYADSGTVEIAGTELGGLSTVEQAEFRAERVSFLYPEFNLIPMLSVYENMSLALSVKKLPEPTVDARIQESLQFLGIEEHAYRRPSKLSTGERARAGLARAIACGNDVLVVDEPTAHLDERSARMVTDLLLTVASDPDRSVIVATHDPVVAEQSHQVITLRDGAIVS